MIFKNGFACILYISDHTIHRRFIIKKVSEYDHEIP